MDPSRDVFEENNTISLAKFIRVDRHAGEATDGLTVVMKKLKKKKKKMRCS